MLQVTKLDTMAGLAIRYGVSVGACPCLQCTSRHVCLFYTSSLVFYQDACSLQVADIKRANGLLSDSAMFAKDKLLIPTQAMPPMG